MDSIEARGVAAAPDADPPAEFDDPRELDYLYNAIDQVYNEFARTCGLSSCAYWMMYEIVREGRLLALRDLTSQWAYSKQTVNSAMQTLVTKGLIELNFCEGSKKNKLASLTVAGEEFSERYIVPAIEAERRAFCTLDPEVRALVIRAMHSYTDALRTELEDLKVRKKEERERA